MCERVAEGQDGEGAGEKLCVSLFFSSFFFSFKNGGSTARVGNDGAFLA